jgi:hypothetical protein
MKSVVVYHSGLPMARFQFDVETDADALNLAWRHTNNVIDSWSRPGGEDAHESLELLEPLYVHEGREYGHRSSVVGDIFQVDGKRYEVDSFGFFGGKVND